MTGKELNMDGTPKMPYRHPHFGQVTTVIHEQEEKQDNLPMEEEDQEAQGARLTHMQSR